MSICEYVGEKGASTIGTVKRSRALPCHFGSPKPLQEHQELFTEDGERFAQFYTKKLACGKELLVCLYRNGLGKVVIMETTCGGLMGTPNQWVFEKDTTYGTEKDIVKLRDQELGKTFPELLCERNLVLTTGQRDPSWFVARLWKLTSSVTWKAIHELAKNVNIGTIDLVSEFGQDYAHAMSNIIELLLGKTDTGKDLVKDRDISVEEIKQLSMKQLRNLAKRVDVASSLPDGQKLNLRKKETLLKQVLDFYQDPARRATVYAKNMMPLVMSGLSFLKPFRSKDLTAGTLNEANITKWASWFLKKHGNGLYMVVPPIETGLVVRADEEFMAFSPDGLCKIGGLDLPEQGLDCVLEVKTKVNKHTVKEVEEHLGRRGMGPLTVAQLTYENQLVIRRHFPDLTHFAQVLHHTCVSGTSRVLYLVADTGRKGILFGVLLEVLPELQEDYRQTLRALAWKYWGYCFGRQTQWPSFAGESGAWGHAGNVEVAQQAFQLMTALTNEVKRRGCPLPLLLRIIPLLVWLWNALKGGIDISTKYTNYLLPPHKKLNVSQALTIRDMLVRVRN
ncbi:unnamed protein product, partial [Heterosigma akashiwo]